MRNWFRRRAAEGPEPNPHEQWIEGLARMLSVSRADAAAVVDDAVREGLVPHEVKSVRDGRTRFAEFRGDDPEAAKRFLQGQTVNEQGVQYVVDTPAGSWGTDIDGLYLENLLDWQRDVSTTTRTATVLVVRDPAKALVNAARGALDNYLVDLRCGGCATAWTDGVQYQETTAVRCPACGAVNRADTREISVSFYDVPNTDEPSVVPPGASTGPLSDEQLSDTRTASRRLAELIEATTGVSDLDPERRRLCLDCDHLDRLVSGEGAVEDWIRHFVEVRAIGHQLEAVGGEGLMRAVHDRLLPDHRHALVLVDALWDRIGMWRS